MGHDSKLSMQMGKSSSETYLFLELAHFSADQAVQLHPAPLFVAEVHANVALHFIQAHLLLSFYCNKEGNETMKTRIGSGK